MFKIMRDTVVNEDVQNIINVDSVDWKQFHGKTIAVTGATGLIGKMCVFALLAADKKYNLNLQKIKILLTILTYTPYNRYMGNIKGDI